MTLRENIRRAAAKTCSGDFARIFGFASQPRTQDCSERFIGLLSAAADIGVTRGHLYQVLKGDRISKKISSQVRIVPIPGKPNHVKVEVV